MKVSIPHKESRIAAMTRIKKMLAESRAQLAAHISDVKEEWKENILLFSFVAQKQHFEGTLTVQDKAFDLYVKLPLTLRLFEGRIQKMIEDETKKMLG